MKQETALRWAAYLVSALIVFVALKYAQVIFAPLLLALVIGVVLSPLSDLWDRMRLPKVLNALLTLAFGVFVLTFIGILIEPLITDIINRAPIIMMELRETVGMVKSLLRGFNEVTAEVAAAIDPQTTSASEEPAMAMPSVSDALFFAPQILTQTLVFMGSLFFFVLSRTEIYGWLAKNLRSGDDPIATEAGLRSAERVVSRYFLTITIINISFGVVVGLVMMWIGMPSPIIWGMLAAGLNYILYLGPACVAVMLLIGGIVVFDGLASFLPPAVFVGLNMMEGQFVTPSFVSKQMSVNPLMVFLSLVFWLWFWGPIGGFIAIPLMIWLIAITQSLTAPKGAVSENGQISSTLLKG